MSRSNYSDGLDQWDLIRWRGAVASAIRGRRGQAFLREMLEALDALPEPRLISHDLIVENALVKECGVCAIGAVGVKRRVDMSELDPEDSERIAAAFGISDALTREIEFVNDEMNYKPETPEQRFIRVRNWVESQIADSANTPEATEE